MTHLGKCSKRVVARAWQYGGAAAVVVYLVLLGVGAVLRKFKVTTYPASLYFNRVCWAVTNTIMFLGALNTLLEATDDWTGLVICRPWQWTQWVGYLADMYFVMRLLMVWLTTFRPPLLATLVDVWLFTQGSYTLVSGGIFLGFRFLTFLRFVYPEWQYILRKEWEKNAPIFWLIVGVLVMAGALQTTGEWGTIRGLHRDANNHLQPITGYWSYVYMTVITASTIGYGDMLPTTAGSQLVVVVSTILFVVWFINQSQVVSDWVKQQTIRTSFPPPTDSPHVVIFGANSPAVLSEFCLHFSRNADELKNCQTFLIVDEICFKRFSETTFSTGITVISNLDLKKNLRKLLPKTKHNYKVIILANYLTDNPRHEDAKTLMLLNKAKGMVPNIGFTVQVMLKENRRVVETVKGWGLKDQVVCLEELCVNLLFHTVTAPGSASILADIVASSAKPIPLDQGHSPDNLSSRGKRFQLLFTNIVDTSHDFVSCAQACYFSRGDVLLGWHSPQGNELVLLPRTLPADTIWIMLSWDTCEMEAESPPQPLDDFDQYLSTDERLTVAVWEGPSSGLMEAALQRFKYVEVVPRSQWTTASTVVVVPPQGPRAKPEVHKVKSIVSSFSPDIRVVSCIPPGREEAPVCSHSVNQSTFTSAVTTAVFREMSFRIWSQLVGGENIASVRVLRECTYGSFFLSLLLQKGLLAIGVYRNEKGMPAVTLPLPGNYLHDGDVVVVLKLNHNTTPPNTG